MESQANFVPAQALMPKLRAYLDSLANGVEFQIKSLPTFNRLVIGFERRKMVVVGARPSEGKSAFCLQLAHELSLNFKVLYITLEMTSDEAMFRLLCYDKQINNTDFYSGGYEDYKKELNEFDDNLNVKKRRLIIIEELGRSWDEINFIFEKLSADRPDIVFLDYVQCIRTKGKRMDEIEDYIKNFRELAIKNNFCLFLCSQINRQNVTSDPKIKEPSMEGLKNTGILEEQADKVVLLYYPCKRSPNIDNTKFRIIVSKNKNGMTGYIDCKINAPTYCFYEVDNIDPKESQEELGFTDD